MKKFLSLSVIAAAMFASIGCDDKKPETKAPSKAAEAGKKTEGAPKMEGGKKEDK